MSDREMHLHNGEEPVQNIDSLNKSLGAVAKETGQAPQILHFGVSALWRYSIVALKTDDQLLESTENSTTSV